jgi:hypothetical protein
VKLTAPEPLTERHRLSGFDCGQPALNDRLGRRALRNQQSGATRTSSLCREIRACNCQFPTPSSAIAV